MESNVEQNDDYFEDQMKQKTVLRTEYAQMKSKIESGELQQKSSMTSTEKANLIDKKPAKVKGKFSFLFFKNLRCKGAKSSPNSEIIDVTEKAGPSEQRIEFDSHATEVKEMKMLIENLNYQLQSKNEHVEQITEENRKLLSENKQIRNELILKQNNINILSNAIELLDRDMISKTEECERLQSEFSKLEDELKSKEKTIEELQKRNIEGMAEVDDKIKKLQNDNDCLKEELKATNEELGRIQKQMELAVSELKHQRKISSLEGKISIIHNNMAQLSEKVSLESESSSVKKQLDEMLSNTHQMNPDISQMQITDDILDVEEEYDIQNESITTKK